MKNFILWLLPKIARLFAKNKILERQKYPQLWYYMPKRWVKIKGKYYSNGNPMLRRAKLRLFLERLCGILTGHELSKTEWGYNGGNFLDRNCRWCDKSFVVPKDEEPTKRDFFEKLFKNQIEYYDK